MTLPTAIRRLRSDVELPRYQTPGAAGFDLAASDDVVVQPGQVVLVPTGLVIQAPPGHFLAIVARSSTPMKRGLMVANGVGIVDEDYCGPADEVKIEVVNFTQQAVKVARGDRLAQGLFIPVVRAEWRETDGDMREGSRGGFGATGA
jgi:dUTP pyrophosphatase